MYRRSRQLNVLLVVSGVLNISRPYCCAHVVSPVDFYISSRSAIQAKAAAKNTNGVTSGAAKIRTLQPEETMAKRTRSSSVEVEEAPAVHARGRARAAAHETTPEGSRKMPV